MTRSPRYDQPGTVHHVMARGIEKREIFLDDVDRRRAVRIVRSVLEDTATRCLAWSFMPNHMHFGMQTGEIGISQVMHRIDTTLAVTFNARHGRVGPVFQGRFRSIPVHSRSYLFEVIRYIHLNPLRAGLVKSLEELELYPWTGYRALRTGVGHGIVDVETVLDLFSKPGADPRAMLAEHMMQGWVGGERPMPRPGVEDDGVQTRHDRATPPLLEITPDGRVIADVRGRCELRDTRRRLIAAAGVTPESIRDAVCREKRVAVREMLGGSRRKVVCRSRAAVAWLSRTYTGCSNAEIARLTGVTQQAVPTILERGEEAAQALSLTQRVARLRP